MTKVVRSPPAWEPQFEAMDARQEALAIQFCAEIAGPRGQPGRPPDAVRLLEMAQALYQAERDGPFGINGTSLPPSVGAPAEPTDRERADLAELRLAAVEDGLRTLDRAMQTLGVHPFVRTTFDMLLGLAAPVGGRPEAPRP